MSRFLIYGLTDPRTGEIRYVGQSSRGLSRPRMHGFPSVLREKGTSHRSDWIRSLKDVGVTYGIVVLEECADTAALDAREKHWIAQGRRAGWRLTNHAEGGRVNRGMLRSAEWREKQRASHVGRPLTMETRAKLSAVRMGRAHSPETIEKIRQAKTGKKRPPFSAAWIDALSRASSLKGGWKRPDLAERNSRGRLVPSRRINLMPTAAA